MFALLLSISTSMHLFDTKYVKQLSSRTWEQNIENRKPSEVWIVMFFGDYCPACIAAAPEFSAAAKKTNGFINFGSVDTQKEGYLSSTYDIRSIPTFFIFHNDGYDEYIGFHKADAFVEGISPYYDGCLSTFEKEMVDKKLDTNVAVYFSNRQEPPMPWKLLSCKLSKLAKFAYSNDAFLRINVGAINPPGVFMRNKSMSTVLTTVKNLSKTVKSFFEGKYKEPYIEPQYYLPSEMGSECRPPTKMCVVINKDDPPKELNNVASKYIKQSVKFFLGDDWKYPSLKKQDFAIIEPNQKKYYPVSKFSDLANSLENCLNNNTDKCRMIDINV